MQIASAEKRDDTSEAARLRQEYEEQQEAWRAQQDLNLVAPRDVNIDAPPLSSSKVQNLRILLERSAAASQALLSAEDHFMRGNGFRAAEEYDRAVLAYTRSIELDSSLSNAYGNRGNTYTKIGDYHHAFEDYDKTIQLTPDRAPNYYNRGNAYAQLREYDRALADFTMAIQLAPDYTAAYGNRATLTTPRVSMMLQ